VGRQLWGLHWREEEALNLQQQEDTIYCTFCLFYVGVAAGGSGPPGEPVGGERGAPALGPLLEGGGGSQPPALGHHQYPGIEFNVHFACLM
jgi:hypothetical protein